MPEATHFPYKRSLLALCTENDPQNLLPDELSSKVYRIIDSITAPCVRMLIVVQSKLIIPSKSW